MEKVIAGAMEIPMKKRVFFLSILLAAVIFYWFYLRNDPVHHQLFLIGKPAPDFSLSDEKGGRVRLSDFRGKMVLLHFWATWCPPCVGEFPLLNDLYRRLKNEPFVLLAVSMDEEGMSAIKKFRKMVSFDFPIYLNPDQSIADLYGTYGLPESFLINKEGVVVKKMIGPQEWNDPKWEKKVRGLF